MTENAPPSHNGPIEATPLEELPSGTGGKRRIGWAPWVASAILLSVLGWLYLENPADASLFPKCAFHATTGLYCPGCGTARAIHHLLHGRLLAALDHNLLAVTLLPLLLAILLADWKFRTTGRSPRWLALSLPVAVAIFFLLLLFGVLRNLPYWPWELLAPPS
jgi:peptidoglycan/LPS O-acetylase OafA/YrhL